MGRCRAIRAQQNSGVIQGNMTFLVVQITVACEIHSWEWIPEFSQMVSCRLPSTVLNCGRKKRPENDPPARLRLRSPLLSSSQLAPIHLINLRSFRDQMSEGTIPLSGFFVTRELNLLAGRAQLQHRSSRQFEPLQGWKQIGRGNNCYCELQCPCD